MLSAVYAVVMCLSVCVCVCVSVTLVKLLITAYFTGELTQRDPQEVREEGP